MPNHVTSELIFRDLTDEQHAELVAAMFNREGDVDFSVLVPEPLNMWRGNEGMKHEKAFGKRLGMVWARENWGTKWNAYMSRKPAFQGGVLTVAFDTAWSPPYPWIVAIFNRFDLSFEHNWLDEGAEWSVSGRFIVSKGDANGPQWDEERASLEVQERLHTLKWGVPSFEDDAS